MQMVQIVTGGAHDVPTVDALMQASFDARYGEAWTAGQTLGVLALPGVWLTLAHVDDKPAGFALARAVADEAELLLLASRPDQRRAGVGSALLRAVSQAARERHVARLHLEVRADNPAIAFYTRHGFAQVGARRDYYKGADGTLRDALTYARDL